MQNGQSRCPRKRSLGQTSSACVLLAAVKKGAYLTSFMMAASLSRTAL